MNKEDKTPEWVKKGLVDMDKARRVTSILDDDEPGIPVHPLIPVGPTANSELMRLKEQADKKRQIQPIAYESTVRGMLDKNEEAIGQQQSASIVAKMRKNIMIREQQAKEEETKHRVAAPGEYVIMLQNNVVFIGDLQEAKIVCEKLVMKTENLQDDDIVIFERKPLSIFL